MFVGTSGAVAAGCTWGYIWYNWIRLIMSQQCAYLILMWGVVEIIFYVVQMYRYRICSSLSFATPVTLHYKEAFRRFLGLSKFMQIEPFLSTWFHGVPFERIKRGNAEEFFSYGFLYRNFEELDVDKKQWVQNAVRVIEDAWRIRLAEGYSEGLHFMAHLHEPLRVMHKPLVVYIIMELAGILSFAILRAWGFRFERVNGTLIAQKQQPTTLQNWKLGKNLQLQCKIQWPQLNTAIELGMISKFGAAFTHFLVHYHNSYLTYKFDTFADFLRLEKYSFKQSQKPAVPDQWNGFISLTSVVSETQHTQNETHANQGQQNFDAFYHNQKESLIENQNKQGSLQQEKIPILFLHGIGAGTLPYLGFVMKIMREFPDHPIILADMRHVSMRWTNRGKSVNDVASDVATLFSNYGIDRVHVIGHSYGTLVASNLVHRFNHMVESICLMDPVCLMTCHPTLIHNFIYKGFGPGKSALDYLRYICARDLFIAEGLCRNFWWSGLMLWPVDFPSKTLLAISGKDDLVPSDLILQQLHFDKSGAKVLFNEALSHGEFILDNRWMDAILTELKSVLMEKESL